MKKTTLLLVALAFIMNACGNRGTKTVAPTEEPSAVTEEVSVPTETIDTVAARKKAADELKSWGAKDAYFDKSGYLVYEVAQTDLSASADDVAHEMYKLFMDTPTLNGIRVVDYIDKKELGRYPETPDENE